MSDAQDSATSEPTGRPKRACKPSAKIVDENNSEAIFSHRTATPVTSTQASPARVTHSTSSLSTSTTARSAAQQPQPGPIPSSSTPRLSPDHNVTPSASSESSSDSAEVASTSSTQQPAVNESNNHALGKRPSVSDDDDDVEIVNPSSPGSSQPSTSNSAKRARLDNSDARDANGMYADVHVQSLGSMSASQTAPLNHESPSADIKHFFKEVPAATGEKAQARRQCLPCSDGRDGCPKTNCTISNDCTTMRRHMAFKHKKLYRTWCKTMNFLSMLPEDTSARRKKAAEDAWQALLQTEVDAHFPVADRRVEPVPERVPPYTDALFRKAAIKWLIQTNQPIACVDHPAFQEMINVAARATRGVTIPGRKKTRDAIIDEFHAQMNALSERLNSKLVTGEISLTCDAWSASSGDGYFAVTGHWIEEESPGKWTLQHAVCGFTQMNTAHNGARLGQALFKICERLKITQRIGHITSDNASNNDTMMQEFSDCYEKKYGEPFDWEERHVRCLAHIVNLSTQSMISTRSKAQFYNPHVEDAHLPDVMAIERDEVGLVRAICVKARSSSQRKELFKQVQLRHEVKILNLLLDMKVRWSSTYIMLHRAESRRTAINDFVYELGMRETNSEKRRKIAALQLTDEEWTRVTLFLNLLGHAEDAQQAFSADSAPTLYNALPAIEKMYAAWEKSLGKAKYKPFIPALEAGMAKLDEYYQKTAESGAHIMAMLLHPSRKLLHFKEHWDAHLIDDVKSMAEKKFSERYALLVKNSALPRPQAASTATSRSSRRRVAVESDDEDDHPSSSQPLCDASRPWLAEFNRYLDTVESVPEGMGIVQWWGLNAHRYPVWASLARDYLAVMASSVSSERAFSSAGITISKRRNRLSGDLVEALQCLKCLYNQELIFREVPTYAAVERELENEPDLDQVQTAEEVVAEMNSFSWDSLVIEDDEDCNTGKDNRDVITIDDD